MPVKAHETVRRHRHVVRPEGIDDGLEKTNHFELTSSGTYGRDCRERHASDACRRQRLSSFRYGRVAGWASGQASVGTPRLANEPTAGKRMIVMICIHPSPRNGCSLSRSDSLPEGGA